MTDTPPRSANDDVLARMERLREKLSKTRSSDATLIQTMARTFANELRPLIKRIEELEARPTVKYVGVWKEGEVYVPGNMVTDHGSVWHCNRGTMERPGTAPEDWTLACKAGKSAR